MPFIISDKTYDKYIQHEKILNFMTDENNNNIINSILDDIKIEKQKNIKNYYVDNVKLWVKLYHENKYNISDELLKLYVKILFISILNDINLNSRSSNLNKITHTSESIKKINNLMDLYMDNINKSRY